MVIKTVSGCSGQLALSIPVNI